MRERIHRYRGILWLATALLLTAATPQQEALPEIPWWLYLVAIALFLLVTFFVILFFDWRTAGRKDENE